MNNEEFLKKIDEEFRVHEHEDCIELETWTSAGVNMIHTLNPKTDGLLKMFIGLAESFDVDEEIDVHREDPLYKRSFTIKQSLEDFTEHKEKLESVAEKLIGGEKN